MCPTYPTLLFIQSVWFLGDCDLDLGADHYRGCRSILRRARGSSISLYIRAGYRRFRDGLVTRKRRTGQWYFWDAYVYVRCNGGCNLVWEFGIAVEEAGTKGGTLHALFNDVDGRQCASGVPKLLKRACHAFGVHGSPGFVMILAKAMSQGTTSRD